MPSLPAMAAIRAAAKRLAGIARRTPLVRLDVPAGPAEIWLKLENLQPIGSFKIRGAANAMAHIPPAELARGVLTASAGNMAQGVAWCARERGIPCTVIAPDTAPAAKLSAIERLGGRVIKAPFERWWQTFQDRRYPGVEGTFIHAFDDPHVMAGNGTIGLEILEELPDAEAVVIPWGGGGLACGIAAAMRELAPRCRVFAAEAQRQRRLRRRSPPVRRGPSTTARRSSTASAAARCFPQMFERARTLIDGSLVATLGEIAAAMRLMAERNHVIAEGAGACRVAARCRAGRAAARSSASSRAATSTSTVCASLLGGRATA